MTFLDSDDLWPENALRRQLELMEAYPSARVIWGTLQVTHQHQANPALFKPLGSPVLLHSLEAVLIHQTLFEST